MGCVDTYNMCITRGDSFARDVALTAAYVEVIENPQDYVAHMVFREYQDDLVTPYLTLTAPAEVDPNPVIGDFPVYFRFAADPAQTQALPDFDHVYYVELIRIAAPLDVTRLFQGKVHSND
jgi:hypothetical protein